MYITYVCIYFVSQIYVSIYLKVPDSLFSILDTGGAQLNLRETLKIPTKQHFYPSV